jgi:hypothetical protein
MKLSEFVKSTDVWKIIIMVILLIIILIWCGYTIDTAWGSIYKDDYEKIVGHNLIKIKTQTNYEKDMKDRILIDLGNLYEEKLIVFCKENNINTCQNKIISDVKYYRTIVMAMNDACEDITLQRFIYDNDLYRYSNKNDWLNFKSYVTELFIKEGKKVLINNYDNDKVIMPINIWMRLAGRDLVECLKNNTDQLLEDLKTESVLYHNMKR